MSTFWGTVHKENSKYKARKVKTQGGYTYEILFSTLEPEIQEKIIDDEIKSHSIIPVNSKSEFKTEKLKIEALAKVDLITALKQFRKNFRLQKDADRAFLELYNSGDHFKDIYKIIGKGYNNKQIARKMGLSISNTRMQKWHLHCFLGEIHTAIDAVYMGLQMGLLRESDLAEPIREEILDNETEKQMFRYTPAGV